MLSHICPLSGTGGHRDGVISFLVGQKAKILGTEMALLVGRYINKIDKKGRVSVPKPFRAALSDQSFSGIYAFPLFNECAIEACGEDFMARLAESLEEGTDLFSEENDDLSVILESAYELPFDPEGRVVVPQELLEAAGIEGEVQFVGRGQRFRMWNPEAYAERSKEARDRAKARGLTLRLKPKNKDGGE